MAGADDRPLARPRPLRPRDRPRVPDRRRHPRRRGRVRRRSARPPARMPPPASRPTRRCFGLDGLDGAWPPTRTARADAALGRAGLVGLAPRRHRGVDRRRARPGVRGGRECASTTLLVAARPRRVARAGARARSWPARCDVDGRGRLKAGTLVPATPTVRSSAPDHPWVGRGGLKLAHALDVLRHRRRRPRRASTSAPRRAASPTCCCSAGRARRRRRSTSATASWTGGSARDPRVTVHRGRQRPPPDAGRPARPRRPAPTSSPSTSRSSRCALILPPLPPLLAPAGRPRRAREAAVRGRARGRGRRRHRRATRPSTRACRRGHGGGRATRMVAHWR